MEGSLAWIYSDINILHRSVTKSERNHIFGPISTAISTNIHGKSSVLRAILSNDGVFAGRIRLVKSMGSRGARGKGLSRFPTLSLDIQLGRFTVSSGEF